MRLSIPKTLVSAVAFSLLFASSTFAATSNNHIRSIDVRLSETKADPGITWEATPTTSSNDYEITDINWAYGYENWTPGKQLSLTVTVDSTDKIFDKECNVYVSNGDKSSVSRVNAREYRIRINYTPKTILETPQNLYYDDEYLVKWDQVTNAGGYEVKLYKDGNSYKTVSLEGKGKNKIDLTEYATDDSDITIAVRAVAAKDKTRYITASEWVSLDDVGASVSDGSTAVGTFSGNDSNKSFKTEDGGRVSGWQYINNYWYYFDPNNNDYALTDGWLNTASGWYLFDKDGRMLTGWQKKNEQWYFFNPDVTSSNNKPYGIMLTGWIQTGPMQPYYYLNTGAVAGYPEGAMLHDTTTPDGYWVNSNGEWY